MQELQSHTGNKPVSNNVKVGTHGLKVGKK